MKAVMISIQPKWCELIASGKKVIEVRKSRPKIDVPFKCYIYCTYGNALADLSNCSCEDIENDVKSGIIRRYALQEHKITSPLISSCDYGNGKAIGEFVCDKIDKFVVGSLGCDDIQKLACLSYSQMIEYFYKDEELDGNTIKYGYAWHISDLVIYDKPKELGEFGNDCKKADWKGSTCMNSGCEYFADSNNYDYPPECRYDGFIPLTRPPQSWCYVEELK